MQRFFLLGMGLFFMIAALVLLMLSVRDGKDGAGAWTIAARTRFTIAAVFGIVGLGLAIWHRLAL